MSELVSFFTDDHRACDALWAEVEAAAESSNSTQAAAQFAAFDTQMRRHLAWEEDTLFPAFEEATGMRGGPTVVMRAEHTQMRAMLDQMKAALDGGDPELMVDLGDTLLMLIQQHNAKEEGILYPMAGQALDGRWPAIKAALR